MNTRVAEEAIEALKAFKGLFDTPLSNRYIKVQKSILSFADSSRSSLLAKTASRGYLPCTAIKEPE
jgi:hypothetical protein